MPMRKALILDQKDIDTFSDVRSAIVSMGAKAKLYQRGVIGATETLEFILEQVKKADDALSKFYTSGL
jgi:hypothetical protein